jgi:RHS repeat-associated protein
MGRNLPRGDIWFAMRRPGARPHGRKRCFDAVTTNGGGTEDQPTTFTYDLMGRARQVEFPDGSHEDSSYEFGQLKTWRTRRGQTKYIHYAARGREDLHSWQDPNGYCDPATDNGAAPCISRSWADANRLTSLTNIFSSIDYGYDASGQVMWEGDEIAGSGGRTQTNYYRYPSGEVAHLHYPGGAYVRRDYTARGQLAATGWDDENDSWWMKLAAYTYLPDGRVDQIDHGNLIGYGNLTTTTFGYDDRGITSSVQHKRGSGDILASRAYTRDWRDRITSFQKGYNPSINPMEDGHGDRFRYDDEGQLLEGWYNAVDPANSGAGNNRYDGFAYDALGNRTQNNFVASRGPTSFIRRDNGLNQYSSWTPSIIYHDDNYPGWSPPGNGVTMAEGFVTASYNALNQPVAIWSPAYQGTEVAYFGYDPLGRCVKRWVGESGDVYSNPATYFQYDGWDLLQEGSNAWGPARVYVHGNRVDEIVWSYNTFTGDQAYHHYDTRGHCTLLTDSFANILEQYEYDAFGQPYFYDATGTATTVNGQPGSLFGNRFLFTGREWIADLKLYDYRNRMYQPELGRFLQPDPSEFAAGDYNLYRYCHNDPVNKSDPTGLLSLTSQGGGDWDWFNGRVALDQQLFLAREAASVGFIGIARTIEAARAVAGKDATDSAEVEPIPMESIRMSPAEITKQPYPNVDERTRSFTRKIRGKTEASQNRFTGKIRVYIPVGIQSTLPNNTNAYDSAEASQRTRAILSIFKADAAVKELAARGFHGDVDAAKRDVTAKYIEVIRRENTRNIIDTDVNQQP